MTMYRLKNVLLAALVTALAATGLVGAAQASNLDAILKVGEEKNAAARKSQAKIDRLADETRDLLADYKTVMKQVDGLKVYNARLQRQIDNQMVRIQNIDDSIDQVTIIRGNSYPSPGECALTPCPGNIVSPFHWPHIPVRCLFFLNNHTWKLSSQG